MDVYWLQQSEADVPRTDDWLSQNEAVRLSSFRFAKRRDDWRLGRWTAKCAVAGYLKLPIDPQSLCRIAVIPASTGQPEVVLKDRPETVAISISHRSGIAMCAVAPGLVKLGCDLEIIEPRSDGFIADYFTDKEQERIAQGSAVERPLLVTLLWSAKESALKAQHVGLRADTRSVEVAELDLTDTPGSIWRTLQVHCPDGRVFGGWWQRAGQLVYTLVASPPPTAPNDLGAA